MKLSIKGLSIAAALVWGGAIFLTGVLYVMNGSYGEGFLEVCSSIYPGYQVSATMGSVLIATVYGAVDGAISGAVFAWLYNTFRG
jgi:hypothetical protein